jgi:hypothetical protein
MWGDVCRGGERGGEVVDTASKSADGLIYIAPAWEPGAKMLSIISKWYLKVIPRHLKQT